MKKIFAILFIVYAINSHYRSDIFQKQVITDSYAKEIRKRF